MITRRARIQRKARVRQHRATRRGPWRCTAYRRWVAHHHCVICQDDCTQAAHTENNGRGSKGPDSSCIPLCFTHHNEMDGRCSVRLLAGRGTPRQKFEAHYNVDLAEIAAGFFAVWQTRTYPEPPCTCEFSGDQADASGCEAHNGSHRPAEIPQPRINTEVSNVCQF